VFIYFHFMEFSHGLLVHFYSENLINSVLETTLSLQPTFSEPVIFACVGERAVENHAYLEKKLESLLIARESIKNDFSFRFLYKNGKPYKELINLYQEFNPSAIIINAEEAKASFGGIFTENTPFALSNSVGCPVISIHGDSPNGFNDLVLPIDSSNESRQKVPAAIKLAKRYGTKIHVLALSESGSSSENQSLQIQVQHCISFLDRHHIKNTLTFGPKKTEYIIAFCKKVMANLLLISLDNGSPSLFGSNYSQILIEKSEVPIMTIPVKEQNARVAAL
jgi:hypothetical protein